MLAEMFGTIGAVMNLAMSKFSSLAYIDDSGSLKINEALLTLMLHDS
jgi:hypothetical protein